MGKTDYKHGRFTILKSEVDTDDFTREDYIGFCEDNGLEAGAGDYFEEGFRDWCAEQTQVNYESDMDNIESCDEYNVPVALTGTLGLWWGRTEIRPERFESVADAIQRCIIGSDCRDILVEFNDGVITVECYHHDGCNSFTIKALSKKGVAKQFADYKEHDFKRLPYLYAIGI